jgi:hypothetical protein
MKAIDFSRSFFTFRIDTLKKPPKTVSHKPPFSLNNARIPVECVCEIKDKQTSVTQTFVLGGNCKTELVGVKADIFTQPNADFVPIFSRDQFLFLKTFARADKGVPFYPASLGVQPDRQTGRVEEALDSLRIDLAYGPAHVIKEPAAIVAAVLNNQILVAESKIDHPSYSATLVYPIKTINANERDNIYQTDTGPILLPDFSKKPDELITGFELAFSAFNCPSWIEFIIRAKTPVEAGVMVYHYSQSARFESQNSVFSLDHLS